MALKALIGRRFSLVGFGCAQVVIDIEPLVRIVRGDEILHGPTHTYVGALAVAAVTLPTVWLAYPAMARVWNGLIERGWLRQFAMPGRAPAWPVAWGVLLGTVSHVAIDGVMHADMRPFWPFATVNPGYQLISIDALHWACVLVGAVGLVWYVLCRAWTRRAAP